MAHAQSKLGVLDSYETIEVVYAAYDGILIQTNQFLDDIIPFAEECAKTCLKHVSRKVAGAKIMACLRPLAQSVKNAFGDTQDINLKKLARVWGENFSKNLNDWVESIAVLLALGLLDKATNGFLLHESSNYAVKTPFHTCVVCAKEGRHKVCPDCDSGDHYCGAECQKKDWKRHKAQHHA
jgi:hypothetical protein